MTNVISKVKMRTPNCSAFPFSFRNRFSSRIGELTPVACIEMGPNDRLKMSMAHLSRLMPLSAPAMANFRLDVDAVFVPSRIVAKKYERFFNPATPDSDRPYFPSLYYSQYIDILVDYVGLYNKSLLDYLGYPTFENIKDFYRNLITTTYNPISGYENPNRYYFMPESEVTLLSGTLLGFGYSLFQNESDIRNCYAEDGTFIGFYDDEAQFLENCPFYMIPVYATGVVDLLTWLICRDSGAEVTVVNAKSYLITWCSKNGVKVLIDEAETSGVFGTQSEILEQYCNYNNTHISDIIDAYFSWCVSALQGAGPNGYPFMSGIHTLGSFKGFVQLLCYDNEDVVDFLAKKLSLLPIFSFWKCYFDWYVNSVLEHGDDLTDAWSYFVQAVIESGEINVGDVFDDFIGMSSYDQFYNDLLASFFDSHVIYSSIFNIPSRLWAIDRFTGAYTDTQNGNPVLIPVDGTIRDITASNVLQRLLTKEIFGGTRAIDKNEIIYGAKSSNQLLDRTEVLCRKKFNIDIQQVTNSAKSDEFDLGTLGGNGFGMGSDFLFDYTCEERGTVLIFASVVLPPSYVQAMDRCLMHTDFYDFVLPEFDQIGEQEIAPEELYFDKGMKLAPVGYNRRYYENIDMLSSVHGDFKNTLRYWHDARFFKTAPSLSPEFIRIDPENDDLERIFATYNHDQILNFFAFSGVVVRPMSKYVQYGTL